MSIFELEKHSFFKQVKILDNIFESGKWHSTTIENKADSLVTETQDQDGRRKAAIFQLIHKILTLYNLCLKNHINKSVIIKLKWM